VPPTYKYHTFFQESPIDMKRWIKWGLTAMLLALVAMSIVRTLSERRAQQQALNAQTAQPSQPVVELASTDVTPATTQILSLGLPISGALRAVNSAMVKAKVAGELQGLTLREGDRVEVGQIIARVDATEYQARVQQAQEQADAAKTQIDMAQRQFDNNRALVNQGFISSTALDASASTLAGAQATHKAALSGVEVAKKSLDDTVLRSPLSGWVAQRLAQPGERVAIEARVIEVVDLSRLELEITLSAAESLSVKVGQTATLQVDGASQAVTARVTRISPSTQAGSRSVLAYLSVDASAGLRQGLFAQGTLGTGQLSGLSVPLSAVRTDKPAPYVQIIEKNQVAHREVTLGARGQAQGESMVTVKGLVDNSVVIRGEVGPLRAGTAVRFTQASPAPLATPVGR
jgi:RND family efflux transporter MFP subunit